MNATLQVKLIKYMANMKTVEQTYCKNKCVH